MDWFKCAFFLYCVGSSILALVSSSDPACGEGGGENNGVCVNPDDGDSSSSSSSSSNEQQQYYEQQQQPPPLSRRLSTTEDNNNVDDDNEQPISIECGLYLAESTLPGAGLGVFTGVAKEEGDSVAEPDVCIPFIDMYWHNGDNFFPNPFKDYFWVGAEMGMAAENDNEDNEAYCPGLDCAANSHPALINVKKVIPKYNEAGLHRSVSPGAGSRSPYHNGTTFVTRSIPAGGELFKDYGINWFDYRYEFFGDFPMGEHYTEASELFEDMVDLLHDTSLENKDEIMADLYDVIKSLRPTHPSKRKPQNKNLHSFRSRVLNALPDRYEDAKLASEKHNGDITALQQPAATRSLDFLRRHGKCLDNIRGGQSTIPGGGLGAFATRNLPVGTVISASALIHVPDKNFTNMYAFKEDFQGEEWHKADEIIGHQLVLNYCYGHAESTVLLCPYGSGINYINHNREKANAKIRWAENFPLGHNQTAAENGPFEIFNQTEKPFLAFDYVATKTIKTGEEIFLDYGDFWVAAWNEHVRKWSPPKGQNATQYISGRTMNERFGHSVLRTEEEQEDEPYPDNVQIRCHRNLRANSKFQKFDWNLEEFGYHCTVISRKTKKNEVIYSVEMDVGEEEEDYLLRDAPREAIHFFDVPYTSDISLPNAFRHEIGIPDHIFPERWKNLRREV